MSNHLLKHSLTFFPPTEFVKLYVDFGFVNRDLVTVADGIKQNRCANRATGNKLLIATPKAHRAVIMLD